MSGLHRSIQLALEAQDRPPVEAYYHGDSECVTLTRESFAEFFRTIELQLAKFNEPLHPVIGVSFSLDTPDYLSIYPCILALLRQKRIHFNLDPFNQSWAWIESALADLRIKIIICDENFLKKNPLNIISDVKLNKNVSMITINVNFTQNLDLALTFPEIVYVAQTSGTTGKRKSVFVTWNSIGSNVNDYLRLFQVSSVLSVSPPTFDPFYLEITLAFLKKVPIHFMKQSLKLNQVQFSQIVTEYKISWIQITPSLFNVVKNGTCFRGESDLKFVILGGEKCPSEFPASSIQYYNAFGVTEMSCWQSLVEIDKEQATPIWSEKLNLLSETSVTLNEQNEILVSSGSRICHVFPDNGTEINHSKFVVNTGDQGRWSKDSMSIYFVSRSKDFIKIQGKRIALLEIESNLLSVLDVAVKCVQDDHGKRVVGFHKDAFDVSLLKKLPPFMVPDTFQQVPEFPVTPHGKLDKKGLLDMVRKRRNLPVMDLKLLWKRQTGVIPDKDSNFLLNGGDSIQAVQLLGEIEELLDNPDVQTCLELLLNGSFGEFQRKLETLSDPIHPKKNLQDLSTDIVSASKNIANAAQQTFPSFGRGFCHHSKNNFIKVIGLKRFNWSVDLKKCIDATPLIVEFPKSTLLFIGSHSGLFSSIDFDSGQVKWMRDLGDRIESSAALSIDGQLIFVGCYDGCMYAINSQTGELAWSFKTNGMIKTTASLYGNSLFFGSYDHHLYCLDSTTGVEQWKQNISESSILAQSLIMEDSIICATLDGHVSRRNLLNGKEIWTIRMGAPIFSSPVHKNGLLFFATAKGQVYKVNGTSGHHVCVYEAKVAIFSSLILHERNLIFGTHGRGVICLDSDSCQELWCVKHRDHVFATPYVTQDGQILSLGIDGQFIVSQRGGMCHEVEIGEDRSGGFFSSPLACKGVIIVCSRDNRVHCVSL